jgi:hypothetical protein
MKKQVLLLVLLLSLTTMSFAQKNITGTITDEKGEPLIGASIVIEGTNQGVLTDIEGHFSISLSDNIKKLTFAFIGFEKQIIELKNTTKIVVRLKEDIKLLKEVVVTGYQRISCGRGGEPGLLYDRLYCLCYCPTENISWNNKLEAVSLENGATKLTYCLNTTRHIVFRDDIAHHEIWSFAENKVHYTLSKSTDDKFYKQIGTSESDSKPYIQAKGDSTLNVWGGSQFWDKEPNETDSTYYLVEGYVQTENSETRQLVYSQKTIVPPTKRLKINSLYAVPKSHQLEISILSPKEAQTEFMVVDMSGHILLRQQYFLFKENNALLLRYNHLIAGVYLLSVQQNGRFVNRKFVVAD